MLDDDLTGGRAEVAEPSVHGAAGASGASGASGAAGGEAEREVVVLPPIALDPVFADMVGDAVAGEPAADSDVVPGRVLGSDPHDFSGLYMRHRTSFTLHARRFLRDQRDADEVVQEAFLRLFLALPELETELQALAYCRRTITNLCIDRYRASQRRPHLVDLESVGLEELADDELADPVVRAEDAAIVREALSLLSPLHRDALVKREIEEKSVPVIAAELEIPEDSVKHVLFRARRALRRILAGTHVAPGADLDQASTLALAVRRAAKDGGGVASLVVVLLMAVGLSTGPDLRAVPVVGSDLPSIGEIARPIAEKISEVVVERGDASRGSVEAQDGAGRDTVEPPLGATVEREGRPGLDASPTPTASAPGLQVPEAQQSPEDVAHAQALASATPSATAEPSASAEATTTPAPAPDAEATDREATAAPTRESSPSPSRSAPPKRLTSPKPSASSSPSASPSSASSPSSSASSAPSGSSSPSAASGAPGSSAGTASTGGRNRPGALRPGRGTGGSTRGTSGAPTRLPGSSRDPVWVFDEPAQRWTKVTPEIVWRYDEAAQAWYETERLPGAQDGPVQP